MNLQYEKDKMEYVEDKIREGIWLGIVETGISEEVIDKDDYQAVRIDVNDDFREELQESIVEGIKNYYLDHLHSYDEEKHRLETLDETWKNIFDHNFDETLKDINDNLDKASQYVSENMKDILIDAQKEDFDITEPNDLGEYFDTKCDFDEEISSEVLGNYGLIPGYLFAQGVCDMDKYEEASQEIEQEEIEL